MNVRGSQVRKLIPISMAVLLGVFLAVASDALNWSGTSTLVVGCALVAVLALLGTPLMLLDLDHLDDALLTVNPAEELGAVVRANLEREIAAQLKTLHDPSGKTQNLYFPFLSPGASHSLRTFNEAATPDFLKESTTRQYRVALNELPREALKNTHPSSSSDFSSPAAFGMAGFYEVKPIDVTYIAALGQTSHQIGTTQYTKRLQPALVAAP